jgi:hypothetical protein
MNERIKLLLEQSGLQPYYDAQEGQIEKFAELIVQECIDIIAPYTVRMSRPGEEYLHPIQEIKKNFGVEE